MARERLDEMGAGLALLRGRNLRDLGGLPTRELGLVIKPRCFFRGSTPSGFALDEWRALTSLNLRSAIDLRSHTEVAECGVSLFSAEVQALHLPLFGVARPRWIAPRDQSPRATAARYFEMLHEGLGNVAALVNHVAQPGALPFVVSCTAGRDRTGIVVACLLDLLHVTDEAAGVDYAESDCFDPTSGRAHAATIHELLALIRARHGSTQHMLAPHGVTTSVTQTFRRALLAPAAVAS